MGSVCLRLHLEMKKKYRQEITAHTDVVTCDRREREEEEEEEEEEGGRRGWG